MKRSVVFVILSVLGLSQSGCVVGLATGNGLLAAYGAGLTTFGMLTSEDSLTLKIGDKNEGLVGVAMIENLGVLLDQKSPGSVPCLNALPVDSAYQKAAHASSLEELELYNQELPAVLDLDSQITSVLKTFAQTGISSPELDRQARSLGLSGKSELLSALSGSKLPRAHVQAVAEAQGLSESTLRIYLRARFGIVSSQAI